MTRWARKGPANKKRPLDATDWEEMVNDVPSTKKSTKKTRNESDSIEENRIDVQVKVNESVEKKSGNKSKKKRKHTQTTSGEETEVEQKQKRAKIEDGKEEDKKANLSLSSLGKLNMFGTDLATALENHDKGEPEIEKEEEEEMLIEEVETRSKRSEMRRLKRITKRQNEKVCFHCRKPGHDFSSCPEAEKLQQSVDICFRCGSGEHKVSQCKSKKFPQGKFPFANCFICGESGHLSRSCPENRNGVYPNGGCCLECGSIYHFKKDCPDLLKKKGKVKMSLKTFDKFQSTDDDPVVQVAPEAPKTEAPKKKQTKVVKF